MTSDKMTTDAPVIEALESPQIRKLTIGRRTLGIQAFS